MKRPVVSDFMTAGAHTIERESPLAAAHELMRRLDIRHLPVLHGGRLVGLVSIGDLHFIETLQDVDPNEVLIAEAMSPGPFVCQADAPLAEVAAEMADKKYGSAVVVDGNRVIGIFTVTDALRALAELLDKRKRA